MPRKCLPWKHNKKLLPWFFIPQSTTDPWARLHPHWACTNCGKMWYKNKPTMIISSIEGIRTPWIKYEGEGIAKGYGSDKEMYEAIKKSRDEFLKKLRKGR